MPDHPEYWWPMPPRDAVVWRDTELPPDPRLLVLEHRIEALQEAVEGLQASNETLHHIITDLIRASRP